MPEKSQPQSPARKSRPKPFSKLTFAEKFRLHPFYSAWALASLLLWMLPGVITIIYYLLTTPAFIPTVALRVFASTSSVPVSLIALGMFFFGDVKNPLRPLSERTLQQHLKAAFLTFVCAILFGFMWLMFLNGPASFALHLVATKESRSMVEQVVKTDSVSWRDHSCGGTWAAVLEDSNAWWPRRLCDITHSKFNEYRHGGIVKLDGKVSWFGIQYDSYAFVSSDGQRQKP